MNMSQYQPVSAAAPSPAGAAAASSLSVPLPWSNWALRRQGLGLWLSDQPVVVQQREPIELGPALVERVHWGRTFAEIRARDAGSAERLFRLAATPILPRVLFFRHFRQQLAKGRDLGAFLRAAPMMLLLLQFWSLGEFLGYWRPGSSQPGAEPREP